MQQMAIMLEQEVLISAMWDPQVRGFALFAPFMSPETRREVGELPYVMLQEESMCIPLVLW
jgi:hypothetical protein